MKSALVIVDVQNDFIEGGSLAVPGGLELAERLGSFIQGDHGYDHIVVTQDWHINPGSHFSEKPDYVDSWPRHCVANSYGARAVPALNYSLMVAGVSVLVRKGMQSAAYSGFEGVEQDGTPLVEALKRLGVTDLAITGIATDYCVKATAFDAVKEGFNTSVLKDFVVGINQQSCSELLKKTFTENKIKVV